MAKIGAYSRRGRRWWKGLRFIFVMHGKYYRRAMIGFRTVERRERSAGGYGRNLVGRNWAQAYMRHE